MESMPWRAAPMPVLTTRHEKETGRFARGSSRDSGQMKVYLCETVFRGVARHERRRDNYNCGRETQAPLILFLATSSLPRKHSSSFAQDCLFVLCLSYLQTDLPSSTLLDFPCLCLSRYSGRPEVWIHYNCASRVSRAYGITNARSEVRRSIRVDCTDLRLMPPSRAQSERAKWLSIGPIREIDIVTVKPLMNVLVLFYSVI